MTIVIISILTIQMETELNVINYQAIEIMVIFAIGLLLVALWTEEKDDGKGK